ncbi:hypothetical protein ISCGN_008826 [Ixodes scapularis]
MVIATQIYHTAVPATSVAELAWVLRCRGYAQSNRATTRHCLSFNWNSDHTLVNSCGGKNETSETMVIVTQIYHTAVPATSVAELAWVLRCRGYAQSNRATTRHCLSFNWNSDHTLVNSCGGKNETSETMVIVTQIYHTAVPATSVAELAWVLRCGGYAQSNRATARHCLSFNWNSDHTLVNSCGGKNETSETMVIVTQIYHTAVPATSVAELAWVFRCRGYAQSNRATTRHCLSFNWNSDHTLVNSCGGKNETSETMVIVTQIYHTAVPATSVAELAWVFRCGGYAQSNRATARHCLSFNWNSDDTLVNSCGATARHCLSFNWNSDHTLVNSCGGKNETSETMVIVTQIYHTAVPATSVAELAWVLRCRDYAQSHRATTRHCLSFNWNSDHTLVNSCGGKNETSETMVIVTQIYHTAVPATSVAELAWVLRCGGYAQSNRATARHCLSFNWNSDHTLVNSCGGKNETSETMVIVTQIYHTAVPATSVAELAWVFRCRGYAQSNRATTRHCLSFNWNSDHTLVNSCGGKNETSETMVIVTQIYHTAVPATSVAELAWVLRCGGYAQSNRATARHCLSFNWNSDDTLVNSCGECNLEVVAVVCDALSSNVMMGKLFGCLIHETDVDSFKTSFPHPKDPAKKIFLIFDACHGLKLLRNLFGDKKYLTTRYGLIQWRFIEDLQRFQEMEGLRAGNKLRRAHVEYYRQIMKVRLAAQTLSSSVSKALELGRKLQLQEFRGSEATSKFIADVDQAFDLLNSHNPRAMGFKAPLRQTLFESQKKKMVTLSETLMSLQLPSGKPVAEDGRRMSVISMAFTLKSVAELADALFQRDMCRYICTYRLSQDHLEMFFSCIRQRGGWNNNPSAVQFRHAYRCLLVHADVKAPTTANVAPDMDGITALRHQGNLSKENDEAEEIDPLQLDTFFSFADHDYLGATHGLTEFSAEIVQYVGGFIVRVVSKKVT